MAGGPPDDPMVHRALGLTDDERDRIEATLGRAPNHLELALYSVMWSEHCSYKSSRLHLRNLPTTGDRVLVGPGENAGVIDAGDGIAVALRIESHNHPSAIEPYQGAATGVGGILRDIFTMGARPLAILDPLFFGPLDDARQRWLFEGVVAGISGYGNSVGVPTVGGELTFDPCYRGNPLVNVMCLGALPVERLVLSAASGAGNLAVLLGSSTGRDGIGGVSVLASAGFDSSGGDDDAKRPSVQVGDPFEEKRLIEACLALLDAGLVVGIQDLGGAGLACATSETAARGDMGMDVDVTAVPRREPNMAPFEVMTSESQERMLAIVTPGDLQAVERLCQRWEVTATVIGTVTEPGPTGGRLRIFDGVGGELLADVPAKSLADEAPLYDRPSAPPADLATRQIEDPDLAVASLDCAADLLALVFDPSWVYEQYDHVLFLNTVVRPGADAALLRLRGPGLPLSDRAIAVSTDSNPRWCAIDPKVGTALTLAEGLANLACVGAEPVAVVNCLNFGNPEHPEVMWQLIETVAGLSEACEAFGVPVVGGNVSLYNESDGEDIHPTPVLGVLGLVHQLNGRPPGMTWSDGDAIVVLGPFAFADSLAGSLWSAQCRPGVSGPLPGLDFEAHGAVTAFVRDLVKAHGHGEPLVSGVHDVSAGGLGVALAEMGLAASCGAVIDGIGDHRTLFNEAPSRFVMATADPGALMVKAAAAGIECRQIGRAIGDRIRIGDLVDLGLDEIQAARTGNLAGALGH